MNQRYYLSVFTAFLIWGFMPLAVRALQGYSVYLILYFRVIVSLLLLVGAGFTLLSKPWKEALQVFAQQTRQEKQKVIGLTIFSGILLVANWGIFIYVVNYIDTQSGAFAYTICPIITAILGYVILDEKLARHQWLAIGLCAISCSLMAGAVFTNFLFSVLIGFLYALYLVLQRFLKEYDKIVLLTLQLSIAAVLIVPTYSYLAQFPTQPLDSRFFWLVLMVSFFFTVLPLFLNLYALKGLKSATVGVFMYLNPLTGFTLAFLYFNETVTANQLIAYLLITLAILLYNGNPIYKLMKKSLG
jgi:chloramphenicol-sensitive protein RarD